MYLYVYISVNHASNMLAYLPHFQLQFVCDLHRCLLYHHQVFDRKGRTGQEGITSAPVPASTSCLIPPLIPQAYTLKENEWTYLRASKNKDESIDLSHAIHTPQAIVELSSAKKYRVPIILVQSGRLWLRWLGLWGFIYRLFQHLAGCSTCLSSQHC